MDARGASQSMVQGQQGLDLNLNRYKESVRQDAKGNVFGSGSHK